MLVDPQELLREQGEELARVLTLHGNDLLAGHDREVPTTIALVFVP